MILEQLDLSEYLFWVQMICLMAMALNDYNEENT
jgi:hypothetical protein